MSGTVAGGRKAAKKNKANDPDFYRKMGAKGGSASGKGGFGQGEEGRERARKYGALGGRKSKRVSNK